MTGMVGKGGRTPPYLGNLNDLKERMNASPNKDFRGTIEIVYACFYGHPFWGFLNAKLIKNDKIVIGTNNK